MTNMPAEVFPPGEFLKEELEARGWTQTDLAEILGRPPRVVNEIIAGKRAVTPETARGLADALGTSAELWMNLESSYRLWRLARKGGSDPHVSRRAQLHTNFPVKDMLRRKWLDASDNVDVLEQRVMHFFRIKSLDEKPVPLAHAARKSTSYDAPATPAQVAWLLRAQQLARSVDAVPYTPARFETGLARLRTILANAEDVRHLPRVLADMGVRLVIVEALPGTKIDGASLWLDSKTPVIVLSLRFDRIDWLWFTILHELAHIRSGTFETIIDAELFAEDGAPKRDKPRSEKDADRFATEFLVPQPAFDHFIARVEPLYSKTKIRGFAALNRIHPGLVVGQLQRREQVPYSHFREMLARIRELLVDATLTDGWGRIPPAT